jgi:hypothetical protein
MEEERCRSWKLLGGGTTRLKLLKSEEVVKVKDPSSIVFGSGEGPLKWVGDGPAWSISSLDKLSILFLVQLLLVAVEKWDLREGKEEREGNESLDFAQGLLDGGHARGFFGLWEAGFCGMWMIAWRSTRGQKQRARWNWFKLDRAFDEDPRARGVRKREKDETVQGDVELLPCRQSEVIRPQKKNTRTKDSARQ